MHERQEREYPLRKGSVIRTEEGILFSRCSPGSIPITTDPEVEYNDILDAYGDALDDIERMKEELETAHDAIELSPLKDIEIHERTQYEIDKTVLRILAEKAEGESTRLREALDRIHTDATDAWASGYALRTLQALSSKGDTEPVGAQRVHKMYLAWKNNHSPDSMFSQETVLSVITVIAGIAGITIPGINTEDKTKTPATGTEESDIN